MARKEVTISREYVVTLTSTKRWVTTTTEKQGTTFIKLEKFDRPFIFFCLGEAMNTSRKTGVKTHRSANVPQFNDLLEQRKVASENAAELALAGSTEPGKKKRKIREEDVHICEPVVSITLPAVNGLPAASCKVLWAVSSHALWVELNAPNLEHIKALVKAGQPQMTIRKRASPKKKNKSAGKLT